MRFVGVRTRENQAALMHHKAREMHCLRRQARRRDWGKDQRTTSGPRDVNRIDRPKT